MANETRVQIPESVISKNIAGEEVLLDIAKETYYGLNETGSFIWSRLKDKRSVVEISRDLAEEFAVDEQTANSDVNQIVAALVEKGLCTLTK